MIIILLNRKLLVLKYLKDDCLDFFASPVPTATVLLARTYLLNRKIKQLTQLHIMCL